MPLNTSGPIAIGGSVVGQSINLEIGRISVSSSNLNETALRSLAGKAAGLIGLSNFYGKSGGSIHAYFCGGRTSSLNTTCVAEIDGINFTTNAAINPTAALSAARAGVAGASAQGANIGHIGGGVNTSSVYVTTIDQFLFSAQICTVVSDTLSAARWSTAAFSNGISKSYWTGGYNGVSYFNEIDGVTTAGTAFNPAATLAVARSGLTSAASSTVGYAMGGDASGTSQSEIDGLIFSSETATNPSATLTVARSDPYGLNSQTKGYAISGIASGTVQTEIDGIQFSTETSINPSAVIATGVFGHAGASHYDWGYTSGGRTIPTAAYNTVNKFFYPTETMTVMAATLATARAGLGGIAG